MNPGFDPEALAELADAVGYYESCNPGLGLEFADEVRTAITRIASAPDRWRRIGANVRRYVLPERFPYLIFYLWDEERVTILAISHASRRPGYWRRRLE
ncbi:MAG: type II toxin-antitoxin system RelE/ParE family toxin [Verrucomicrobia bacterium]|nr:type II toxin-antitoxin system RelE/ParE family toxin [Verrucomicrobiota bacterium]MBV9659393.1 type II toxin-antitoxin system RelE/ParE family toxin [Verrucomicrobiota bacterium]